MANEPRTGLCRVFRPGIHLQEGPEPGTYVLPEWHDRYMAWQDELDQRGPSRDPKLQAVVHKLIEDIRRGGAKAAWRAARKFDAPELKFSQFEVSEDELWDAEVEPEHARAIQHSIERVRAFHEHQLQAVTQGWTAGSDAEGAPLWRWTTPARPYDLDTGYEGQLMRPLQSVGLYIPGGQADYASSVIMTAVPAIVAGVDRLVMCCPPRKDGTLSPAVLYAARSVGVETIYKVGGASAVAFMALAAFDHPAYRMRGYAPGADKVVGPGNKYVNEAKRQLWGAVGLDAYAGPSEVAVVVDESADARAAAVDWLTQVEHAEDNEGYLFSTSEAKLDEVLREAERLLDGAPRAFVMRRALKERGVALFGNRNIVLRYVNLVAPEHLTLMVADPEWWIGRVANAGCILVGEHTPQSAGDFCSGPSHTLPTARAARFGSPLSVLDFLKVQSLSRLTHSDLAALRPTIEAFGDLEGFPMHGMGATVRFEDHGAV